MACVIGMKFISVLDGQAFDVFTQLGNSANMRCLGEVFFTGDVRYEDRWFSKFQSETWKIDFRGDEIVLGREKAQAKDPLGKYTKIECLA